MDDTSHAIGLTDTDGAVKVTERTVPPLENRALKGDGILPRRESGNWMFRSGRETYARYLNITVYSIAAATEAMKCYFHNGELRD